MNGSTWSAALGTMAVLWSAHLQADTPSRWTARVGYALASFDVGTELSVAGAPIPGAAVGVADQGILLGDVGYDFADHWTARVAVGAPVQLPVQAAGTLQSLPPPFTGTLGEIEIAPVVVSVLYAPLQFKGLAPYVGAGASYTYVLGTTSGDIASLGASSAWGAVVQAGCNYSITPRLWAFADARKIYFSTTASGTVAALGGAPVEADVTLDPLILNAGLGYRF